jgi:tRNA A-37 threonylcarbamoyl transferase component Bud32
LAPRAFANYVLLERIGQGGMSEIDLARKAVEEASFVRFLCIKRIKADRTDDPSFVRMFKDEARICSELHHGNIAQTYDFGKFGDEYYLVLEYVPGIDVRKMVNTMRDQHRAIPLRITLRILCEVLDGLHYAHTKMDTFGRPMRIVHRDVNPRNIMVSTHGESKLIDFGVAKAQDRLERTRTDHVKGKFAYMAPEQVNGHEVDHRADVFATALTLHEMVAGYGPFWGLNHVQIMHRLTSGSIPDLPDHPDLQDMTALRKVQRKALAASPKERYPDAESYRKDLERVADRMGGLATRQEVAAFVNEVDPGLDERLKTKMAGFSGPLQFEAAAGTGPAPAAPAAAPEPSAGTIDKVGPSPMSGSFSQSVNAKTAGVAAVGGLALVAVAFGLLIVVGIVVAGVVTASSGEGIAATTDDDGRLTLPERPRAEDDLAPQHDPAPAPATTDPVVSVEVSPGIDVADEDGPRRRFPPVQGSDVAAAALPPEDLIAERAPDAPDPAPTATMADVATPPVPPPEPGPAVKNGTLQVTASERGKAIFIEGKDTGFVTPAEIEWPAGTWHVRVDGWPTEQVVTLREEGFRVVAFK